MKEIDEIITSIAGKMDTPEGREETLELAKQYRKEREQRQDGAVGRYVVAKLMDVFAVLLLLAYLAAVITLFTRSLFQGFIALVIGFFLIRYVFKKRNQDWSSWFFRWF